MNAFAQQTPSMSVAETKQTPPSGEEEVENTGNPEISIMEMVQDEIRMSKTITVNTFVKVVQALIYKTKANLAQAGKMKLVVKEKITADLDNVHSLMELVNTTTPPDIDAIQTELAIIRKQVVSVQKDVSDIRKSTNENDSKELMHNIQKFGKQVKTATEDIKKSTPNNKTKKDNDYILVVKQKKGAKKTIEDLKRHIDPVKEGVDVTYSRVLQNGELLVKTKSSQGITRLKTRCETLEDFEVKTREKWMPQIIIHDIPTSYTHEELQAYFQDNYEYKPDFIRKFTYKDNTDTVKYVVRLTPLVFKKIISQKRIMLGWTSHRIYEYFSVLRCSTCQSYGHHHTTCKNTPAEKDQSRCIPCGTSAHRISSCPAYEKYIQMIKRNIQYV